jgi:hypothetical protein
MNQETYICSQFHRVLPTNLACEYQVRMQMQSELGKTNWINITEAQFREIECLLATWQHIE